MRIDDLLLQGSRRAPICDNLALGGSTEVHPGVDLSCRLCTKHRNVDRPKKRAISSTRRYCRTRRY
jgi:hypothetical protein